jgi:hypothetical protein
MGITILCDQRKCIFNIGEWSKIDIPARGIERVCMHKHPDIQRNSDLDLSKPQAVCNSYYEKQDNGTN